MNQASIREDLLEEVLIPLTIRFNSLCLLQQTLECATGWMFGGNETAGQYGRRSACYFRQYWFGICSHGCHVGRSRKCKYSTNTRERSVVSLDTYSKTLQSSVVVNHQSYYTHGVACSTNVIRSLTIYRSLIVHSFV
jgi:hypothetical protein